jgi:hypothetical protein
MIGPGLLSLSTIAMLATAPDADAVTLRAYVLDLEGVQWRADLINLRGLVGARTIIGGPAELPGGLQPQDVQGPTVVWTADPRTLERLIAASTRCTLAGADSDRGSGDRSYVAAMEPVANGSAGPATGIAFRPQVGTLPEGLSLAATGRRVPMGVLADVAIEDRQFVAFHTASCAVELGLQPAPSNPLDRIFNPSGTTTRISAQMQVPEVITGSASGQWLLPSGGALVIALGVQRFRATAPAAMSSASA